MTTALLLLLLCALPLNIYGWITKFDYPNINNNVRQNMTLISLPQTQPSNALRLTEAVPLANVRDTVVFCARRLIIRFLH